MTRFIYDTAASLNGWIADSQHSLQWLFDVPGGAEPDPQLLPPERALIVEGSSTYEWILRESDLVQHPERWQEFYGSRRTFVFTTRQLPVPDGADVTFVSGPVGDVIGDLRAAAGDDDVWIVGGGDLAGQFLDAAPSTRSLSPSRRLPSRPARLCFRAASNPTVSASSSAPGGSVRAAALHVEPR